MVYMFLADGMEEIEALCPLDLMRRAGIDVTTVGVGGKSITGSHGISVACDTTTKELDKNGDFDMIILPGGLPGSDNLNNDETVSRFIERAVKEDKYICAICAAPYVLGVRGVLKGKRTTCYPGFESRLEGAEIVDSGCVRDGKIITGRAMGSAIDFSLEIIKALCGEEKSKSLGSAVLY